MHHVYNDICSGKKTEFDVIKIIHFEQKAILCILKWHYKETCRCNECYYNEDWLHNGSPFTVGKTSGLEPGTARSADQRLTYWATEPLPVCRDMQAQIHVSPPASLNTWIFPPSTTWLVLLSEGKIASMCVCNVAVEAGGGGGGEREREREERIGMGEQSRGN